MNLFKSIWGLMLGILLLGVNRPIWAVGDITTGRKPAYLGRISFISS